MRDRKLLLQVLLYVALVVSLVVPASVAAASTTVPRPDECSASYLAADSSGSMLAISLNTPEGNVKPMVAVGQDISSGSGPAALWLAREISPMGNMTSTIGI